MKNNQHDVIYIQEVECWIFDLGTKVFANGAFQET